MDGHDLLVYLQNKRSELSNALRISKERGLALAEAERAYKVEKAKFIYIEEILSEKV